MLALKEYQRRALEALGRFYDLTAQTGEPMVAYAKVTRETFDRAIPYTPAQGLPDALPYVCLRMPTGAGKTLVACHAAGLAQTRYLRADRSLILWLVPSTAILSQTLEALRDRSHPYRQALEQACGPCRAISVDEALYLNRTALDGETVVVVATMQAFRVEDTTGRRVYAGDDGALMDIFSGRSTRELEELERFDGVGGESNAGEVKKSLENVLRLYRPTVIVDEAHNFLTDASLTVLERIRPSSILQITATPFGSERHPNVLHSVSAAELKAEHMIKLPVELTTLGDARELSALALSRLNELQADATAEQHDGGRYLRPIMLVQCEPNRAGATHTVDAVRTLLVDELRIPPDQIAVSTGSDRELEGVDILSADCPLRVVLTVQKLREGWDCPFAYVLLSLAALSSPTAVEQFVGRVLRMPHARRKSRESLNRAYVYSATEQFSASLDALVDGLVANGFERQEARDLIRTPTGTQQGLPLPPSPLPLFDDPPIVVPLGELPDLSGLPEATRSKVRYDASKGTITLTSPLTADDRDALDRTITLPASARALAVAFRKSDERSGTPPPPTPAERGLPLAVPLLVAPPLGSGPPELFDETLLMEAPWSLADCPPDVPAFRLPELRAKTALIDLQETVTVGFVDRVEQQTLLLAQTGGWSQGKLAAWLDQGIHHPDILPHDAMTYLVRVVRYLTSERGLTLDQLVLYRHRLRRALTHRIGEHRQSARRAAFLSLIDPNASPLSVDPAHVLSFPVDYPTGTPFYDGRYPFRKHRYRRIGAMNGEEVTCAVTLDESASVSQWVRNEERRPRHSFWLQTSTDRFYPDFVARLHDDRILAVEYKGAHLDGSDTQEKQAIGDFWAARSGGRCLFVMQQGPDLAPLHAALA